MAKRVSILLLAALLLFTCFGCQKKAAEAPTPTEAPAATEAPAPEPTAKLQGEYVVDDPLLQTDYKVTDNARPGVL